MDEDRQIHSNAADNVAMAEWHEAELELAFNCFWNALNNVQYEVGENNNCQEFINYFISLFGCLKNSIEIAQNSLAEWRERQRILSIGPFFMQNQHFKKLVQLRQNFANIQFKLKSLVDALMPYRQNGSNEEFAANFNPGFEPICMQQHEHCKNLFNGIPLLCHHSPHQQHAHCLSQQPFNFVAFKFYWALQQMAVSSLRHSIVFSQQPPVMLQSNRADVNAPRASRSRFDLAIEILGAAVWFPANQMHNFDPQNGEIHCALRRFEIGNAEAEAIQQLEGAFMETRPCNEDFVPSQREERPHFSLVSVNDQLAMMAHFLKLGVNPGHEAERKNSRRPIQEIRYRFCFQILMKFSPDIGLHCWKVTQSFPVIHCKNVQMKTEGLLERAFPSFAKNREEERAYGENVAEILELVFQEEICPIDANAQQNFVGLSVASKRHLLKNLDCAADGFVQLANFFKATAPNRQIGHNLRFNEWFFRLTEIIRDSPSLRQLWERGLIYGFCGKVEAEQILRENYQVRMMLIRFADTALQGDLKITFGKQNYVQHACFDATFLANNNLAIELLENDKFHQIEFIFNWHGQPVDLRAELNQLLRNDEEQDPSEMAHPQHRFSPAFEYAMNQVPGANGNFGGGNSFLSGNGGTSRKASASTSNNANANSPGGMKSGRASVKRAAGGGGK